MLTGTSLKHWQVHVFFFSLREPECPPIARGIALGSRGGQALSETQRGCPAGRHRAGFYPNPVLAIKLHYLQLKEIRSIGFQNRAEYFSLSWPHIRFGRSGPGLPPCAQREKLCCQAGIGLPAGSMMTFYKTPRVSKEGMCLSLTRLQFSQGERYTKDRGRAGCTEFHDVNNM